MHHSNSQAVQMECPAVFVNWNATSQVACSEAGPCIMYLLYACWLTVLKPSVGISRSLICYCYYYYYC